jgi:CRISPR-associated exonuclease Cas4
MHVTGTHFAYYTLCRRKLWLFANGINMEHTSDTVYEGKMIGGNSYPQRAEKFTEIEVDGIKIDFYDPFNKVIHEIKKSDKAEQAHVAQVKYYIYKLHRKGIEGVTGILEYPKLRHTEKVELKTEEIPLIEEWEEDISVIVSSRECPPLLNKKICRQCSYYDFCYSGEES